MNYRNAQDIFPENLLKQIQRYVSGETIYIPAKNEKRPEENLLATGHILQKGIRA